MLPTAIKIMMLPNGQLEFLNAKQMTKRTIKKLG